MSLTALLPAAPARAHVTEYTALIVDGAEVSLNDRFDNASARLSAIAEALLYNHHEIAQQDVVDLLAVYGGANPDAALADLIELFANVGVHVDMHLSEHQRDVGPAVLYSTLTDYGDGTMLIEHFPTAAARLADLRQRAINIDVAHSVEFFEDADEETCRKALEYALMLTRGRISLLEARREAAGEVYVGERI